MTAREAFDYMLIEQNKTEAPSLQLEQYNYYINKAINWYINTRYNTYDVNQQATDDLQVLTSTVTVNIDPTTNTAVATTSTGNITDNYANPAFPVVNTGIGRKFLLPDNYFRLLNCIVCVTSNIDQRQCTEGYVLCNGAKRLTADMYQNIIQNAYLRPKYNRPYYYITDNPAAKSRIPGTHIKPGSNNAEIELRTGDHPTFSFTAVSIDYLRVPALVTLTYEEAFSDIIAGSTADTSQVLEFPDYICFEILNKFSEFIAANAMDLQRASTITQTNQSIGSPAAGR